MGQTAVIIRCEISGQENGRYSRCHNYGQNDLLHLIGTEPLSVVLHGLPSIVDQRIPAHPADRRAKRCEMLQPLSPGRNRGLIIFGIGITDSRPHVLGRCLCNNLRINESVHDRSDKKMRLQKCPVLIVHDGDRRTGSTVGCNGRKGKNRLIIRDAQTLYRIQRLAASHAEYHVCFLIQRHRAQLFHRLVGTVLSVNFLSDNHKPCLIRI